MISRSIYLATRLTFVVVALPSAIIGLFYLTNETYVSCKLGAKLGLSGPVTVTDLGSGRVRYKIEGNDSAKFCVVSQDTLQYHDSIRTVSAVFAEWQMLGRSPCTGYTKGRELIVFYLEPPSRRQYVVVEKFLDRSAPKQSKPKSQSRQCGHLNADDVQCDEDSNGEQTCSAVSKKTGR
jgi:hypothetical protein